MHAKLYEQVMLDRVHDLKHSSGHFCFIIFDKGRRLSVGPTEVHKFSDFFGTCNVYLAILNLCRFQLCNS